MKKRTAVAIPIIMIFMVLSFFGTALGSDSGRSLIRAQGKSGGRLALLVGNGAYRYGGSLQNPVNDVAAMAGALRSLRFSVTTLTNCTQKEMKKAIDTFGRQMKNQEVGLFFYAGHGVQVRGHNYLIPVDCKLENENQVDYDCVRVGRVLAGMESAGTRTNIVILDACRDNPFERSWNRGSNGHGLAFMNAPSGSFIAYATSPGKTASDGRGANSLYTSALVKHIATPGITIEKVFKLVRTEVKNRSGAKQIPWESTSLQGDFYFIGEKWSHISNNVNEISPTMLIDQGGCPFECCRYGTWKTKKTTKAYSLPSKHSKIVGNFIVGSEVEALTGQVQVSPKCFKVYKKHKSINNKTIYEQGDTIWVYTYLGEGLFKVWFKGEIYEEALDFSPYGGSPGKRCENGEYCWGTLEEKLDSSWWIKIRSSDGWEGWTYQSDNFDGKDTCG